MNESDSPLPPRDYLEALERVPGLFIVGGQAVNLWAELLLTPEEIAKRGPFTSYDMDVIGTSATVAEIAQATGWKPTFAPHRTPSPVIARFVGKTASGTTLVVEVLHSLYGLDQKDISKSLDVQVDGKTYRTLSPTTLLKAKLANCAGLDQAGRGDVRQADILISCVRAYATLALRETAEGKTTERASVNLLEAMWALCANQKNRETAAKFGLKLRDVFPAELEQSPLEKVRRFCTYRLPRLIEALKSDERGERIKPIPGQPSSPDI